MTRDDDPTRDQLTREAIFHAARGYGEARVGAYPIDVSRPNPVERTMAMIRGDYPSAERVLSDSDWNSLHAILETRVQECRDERDGHGRKKKREWAKS